MRSTYKGPFVDFKLLRKIEEAVSQKNKKPIKTWSRNCVITPDFIGVTIAVHNGNKFIPIFVAENMIGHKLGEFAPTRTFKGHTSGEKKAKDSDKKGK